MLWALADGAPCSSLLWQSTPAESRREPSLRAGKVGASPPAEYRSGADSLVSVSEKFGSLLLPVPCPRGRRYGISVSDISAGPLPTSQREWKRCPHLASFEAHQHKHSRPERRTRRRHPARAETPAPHRGSPPTDAARA